MIATPRHRIAATLGVAALLAVGAGGPASALPAKDYSMNSVSGTVSGTDTPAVSPVKNYSMNSAGGKYAPAVTPPKDYSMNSAGGENAPALSSSPAAAPASPTTSDGFSWGDALAGAGIGLLIALTALGGRAVARRRRVVTG